MKSLIHFFKYNNAALILFGILSLASGAFAATERQSSVPSAESRTQMDVAAKAEPVIDTTALADTDVNSFDPRVRIIAITEDDQNYSVDYSYHTLAVDQSVWRDVLKNGHMTLSKKSVADTDFGLSLAGQIGQVIDQERAYLREAQQLAKTDTVASGDTAKEYNSLVKSSFDADTKTFSDYVPKTALKKETVVAAAMPEETADSSGDSPSVSTPDPVIPGVTLSKAEINTMIVKAVGDFLAVDMSMPDLTATHPEPTSGNPVSDVTTDATGDAPTVVSNESK